MVTRDKRIVLGVTGSIAAYKSADILRTLIEKGLKVSVVMTKEAEHFITPLTLEALSGEKVYTSLLDEPWKMPHIFLAREADLLLIVPATANIIAKLANGLADDLLTCIAMATKAKIFIAPAMNTEMWNNSFLQENVAKLKKAGVKIIPPAKGNLACGEYGDGHIADEESILKEVLRFLK